MMNGINIYKTKIQKTQKIALLMSIGAFAFLYFIVSGRAQELLTGDTLVVTDLVISNNTGAEGSNQQDGIVVGNEVPLANNGSDVIAGTGTELLLSGSELGSGDSSSFGSGFDTTVSGNYLTGTFLTGDIVGDSVFTGTTSSGTNYNNDNLTGSGDLGPISGGISDLHSSSDIVQSLTGADQSGKILDGGIGILTEGVIEFMQPWELMQYVQRGLIVGSGVSHAIFNYDFVYRTFDDTIRVTLESGLVVSTYHGDPFDLPSFGIYDTMEQTGAIVLDDSGKVPNDGKDKFGFGVDHQHLLFSKPVRIEYQTDKEDGTLVEVTVKHSGELDYGTGGIGTLASNSCDLMGEILHPNNIVYVEGGKIVFYTCGASAFSLSYTGGANFANFVDNASITKTVTFVTGLHLPTGAQISDVNMTLSFRPIDSENPAAYGTTNCYPTEKSFQLIAPDGTVVQIINNNQLKTPNTSCPTSTITFDQQAGTALSNNYNVVGSFRPFGNLNNLNGKSPFGTWTLRMTDSVGADGVILFGFTVSINATDPYICIATPTNFSTGLTSSGSSQIIDYLFDYFLVDDQKGINSGYYTTLSMSNLSGLNGIIPNNTIQWKAEPLTLLSGTANTGVLLGGAISTGYISANTTVTHIYRNNAPNLFRKSTYGSKLNLKVTIPGYTPVGTYTGTITYTLYEN